MRATPLPETMLEATFDPTGLALDTGKTVGKGVNVRHGTILTLEDINVSFDGFKALTNLSLYIGVGELRCIIGPNGAGKSTLFALITRLFDARRPGGVRIFGECRNMNDHRQGGGEEITDEVLGHVRHAAETARDLGLRELYLWPINADQMGTPKQVRTVIDTVRENDVVSCLDRGPGGPGSGLHPPASRAAGTCHRAHSGQGPVLAVLPVLAPKKGLRAGPGRSAPPLTCVARGGPLRVSGRRASR